MAGATFFKSKKRIDVNLAALMYERGWCDQRIADELEIPLISASGWRRRRGLPANPTNGYVAKADREAKPVNTLAKKAAAAKKLGMSYGEFDTALREGKVAYVL